VADGRAELAILLNPPKITEVKDVADAEDRMPHKSTYFCPKPLSGFVINVMDAQVSKKVSKEIRALYLL